MFSSSWLPLSAQETQCHLASHLAPQIFKFQERRFRLVHSYIFRILNDSPENQGRGSAPFCPQVFLISLRFLNIHRPIPNKAPVTLPTKHKAATWYTGPSKVWQTCRKVQCAWLGLNCSEFNLHPQGSSCTGQGFTLRWFLQRHLSSMCWSGARQTCGLCKLRNIRRHKTYIEQINQEIHNKGFLLKRTSPLKASPLALQWTFLLLVNVLQKTADAGILLTLNL